MKILRIAAILALVVCLTSGFVAAAGRMETARSIESLMDEYACVGAFGGALLVADRDGILIEKAYGKANYEWDISNTVDTRFRVGSLSKQFTASLVMRLVDEGRLDLDARLTDILPWYRKETGDQVTIRHLLNHTSGIDRFGVKKMIEEHGRTGMPLKESVITYCSGDFEWEPGTRFGYNNGGYLILGAVIEEISGVSYAEVVDRVIIDPLGMTDTGMDDSRRILARRADGYDRTTDGLRKAEFVEATLASSAGGFYSTVGDLYRWDRALYTDQVLSAAAREQMFRPGMGSYGFGWFIVDMPIGPDGESRTVIRHPGQGDGFYSILWRIPSDGIAIALINNLGRTDIESMASGILDAVYGRTPRVGIAEVVRDVIDKDGIEAARDEYFRLRDESGDRYDFAEEQLNELGYALARRGSLDEGVAVLTLNTEIFPESANTHDSLGEILEHTGDIDAAIRSYQRVLEIDPGFGHAKERLQELGDNGDTEDDPTGGSTQK